MSSAGPKRRPVKLGVSLTERGGELLAALVEHLGATKSVAVEMAIRRLASAYRLDDDRG